MSDYTFTPPTTDETPMGDGPLFSRYKLARGITVLRTAGTYSSYRYPSVDEIDAAQEVYLGGHIYTVDATTAAALTSAGYAANLVVI
jgi:hypothetical protein